MTDLEIRHLQGIAEYEQAVRFQDETWGHGFSERVPKSLMKVAQRLGGVAAGAFDADGRMVGFVYGITGFESGRAVHWSDILAVSPEVRDRGLGRDEVGVLLAVRWYGGVGARRAGGSRWWGAWSRSGRRRCPRSRPSRSKNTPASHPRSSKTTTSLRR